MRKAVLLLAVFVCAGLLWAEEPSMGTWKLNAAKSKLPPSQATLKELIMVFRELDANTIEGSAKITTADGKIMTGKWTTPKSGGIQTYQEGGPASGISTVAVVVDAANLYQLTLQNGKQVELAKIVFSKDFKTYTQRVQGKDAQGKTVEYVGIFEKQ